MTDTVSTPAPVYSVPQERRIVTAVPGPKSQELHQRRLAVVPTGVSSALPIYIAKANGDYKHPFMMERKDVKRVGYVVISTDRGLCG